MTSTCNEACIICDIDGFTGINNSNIQGQAPPGFCTSQVHHMQWIAFIAGTENLTIELEVFNCQKGEGLEVGIYEGIKCGNFRMVTECDTDIPENSKRVFKNTSPLIVGQYYFWVMDGSNNDICNYTIRVLEGSTKVSPLEKSPEIILPTNFCEKKPLTFRSNGLIGATIYDWSVNGFPITSGLKMDYTFPTPGEYEICLDARNVCDKAPQKCIKINIEPTRSSTQSQEICPGECYNFGGKMYCTSGQYVDTVSNIHGCDSLLILNLKVKDQIVVDRALTICNGDSLNLGGQVFTIPGKYIAYILDADGCNIKVNLDLTTYDCKVNTIESTTDVKCNNAKNGKIEYQVTAGNPPLNYKWYKLENETVSGQGSINALNENVTIENLDEGNYVISIIDSKGFETTINRHINQPTKIYCSFSLENYNGYSIPCYNGTGSIKSSVEGGTGQYQYLWSNQAKTANIDKEIAGQYTLSVTDANGCLETFTTTLNAPEKLQFVANVYNPDCLASDNGYIDITSTSGGIAPYTCSFDGQPFNTNLRLDNQTTSTHIVTLQDNNGCMATDTISLVAAEIPLLNFQKNYKVDLGDSLIIVIESNLDSQKVSWTPSSLVTCNTCLSTGVKALNNTTYEVSVISKDGCERKAIIDIRVVKNYSFVISNVISANDDGYNDKIRYNAKNDVASVLYYRVYDRWGNKLYEFTNGTVGLTDMDWDATLNGQEVMEGSYVWMASVAYIDGVVIDYKGSLLILR